MAGCSVRLKYPLKKIIFLLPRLCRAGVAAGRDPSSFRRSRVCRCLSPLSQRLAGRKAAAWRLRASSCFLCAWCAVPAVTSTSLLGPSPPRPYPNLQTSVPQSDASGVSRDSGEQLGPWLFTRYEVWKGFVFAEDTEGTPKTSRDTGGCALGMGMCLRKQVGILLKFLSVVGSSDWVCSPGLWRCQQAVCPPGLWWGLGLGQQTGPAGKFCA